MDQSEWYLMFFVCVFFSTQSLYMVMNFKYLGFFSFKKHDSGTAGSVCASAQGFDPKSCLCGFTVSSPPCLLLNILVSFHPRQKQFE